MFRSSVWKTNGEGPVQHTVKSSFQVNAYSTANSIVKKHKMCVVGNNLYQNRISVQMLFQSLLVQGPKGILCPVRHQEGNHTLMTIYDNARPKTLLRDLFPILPQFRTPCPADISDNRPQNRLPSRSAIPAPNIPPSNQQPQWCGRNGTVGPKRRTGTEFGPGLPGISQGGTKDCTASSQRQQLSGSSGVTRRFSHPSRMI